MDETSELIRKRKEAQETILALRDKTVSVAILNLFGKAFRGQGIFQRLGYWLANIIILNLIMLSPLALIGRALNELDKTKDFWLSGIIIVELLIVGIMVGYAVIQNLFHHLAFVVIKKIDNDSDLSKLVSWLQSTWSVRNISAFILVIAAIWIFLGVVRLSIWKGEFLGFGFTLSVILTGLFAGAGFYVTFWVGLLAANLGNYHYEVDSFFTADSEIVRNISEMLTRNIYVFAAYFAVFTLFGSSRFMNRTLVAAAAIPFLLIVWAMTTSQFVLTRNTLARIVNRAKMKTLDTVRARINSLAAEGDIGGKETAKKILRLMDIYDRVKTVKTETFDFKSVSTFISQLMLPLLGLLLGNLDKLPTLFR